MIDTSAYHKNQCDFEGVTNSIIPMLLQLLAANDIVLLTHPILESEIKKHIKESELDTRIGKFTNSLKKIQPAITNDWSLCGGTNRKTQ